MAATYAGQPPTNGKPRQCEAALAKDGKRKKGSRCPNAPILGSNVCPAHGGKASQVKEAAATRLARIVQPSISLLANVVDPIQFPLHQPTDERPDIRLRVQTAQDILDRTGFKGKQELSVQTYAIKTEDLSEEHLRAILSLKEQLGAGPEKKALPSGDG